MPSVRQVVSRSPHRRVGLIACRWLQPRLVEYESLLERDFIRLALLAPGLRKIISQPFKADLGELGSYTPDFLLVFSNEKLVIEVKPFEHSQSNRNRPRLARAAEIFGQRGLPFFVATDKVIRAGKRHEQASIILRHARSFYPPSVIRSILDVAERHPEGLRIDQLAQQTRSQMTAILYLIGRGELHLNEPLDLSPDSLVFPALQETIHERVHPATWLGLSQWRSGIYGQPTAGPEDCTN